LKRDYPNSIAVSMHNILNVDEGKNVMSMKRYRGNKTLKVA
jgi:hypothetical protein